MSIATIPVTPKPFTVDQVRVLTQSLSVPDQLHMLTMRYNALPDIIESLYEQFRDAAAVCIYLEARGWTPRLVSIKRPHSA